MRHPTRERPPAQQPSTRRRQWLVWLLGVAVLVAFAWPIQEPGWTQKAHHALVRSLADGTARIDRYHKETGDKAYFEGHFYSVKAPGLAVVSLPPYLALRELGWLPESQRTTIWLLNLFTVVPFALLLCLATRGIARRLGVEHGWTAGAVLATGTIVLPLTTIYFSHVPTAALALVGVGLVLRAREDASARTAALAGAAGGLAVFFEYPTAVVGAAVFVYLVAVSRARLRQAAAYVAGVAAGVAPLVSYNAWAFGSPTHLSYGNLVAPEDYLSDTPGFFGETRFGLGRPSLEGLTELLLSERGLVVTAPVLAAGATGIWLLARAGRRAEAWLLGGTAAATLVWNTGYTALYGGAFGGDSPGARYLTAVLPLLVVPLGLALRRAAGATLSAAAVSVGFMTVVTATRPQVGSEETAAWWDGLRDGSFTESPFTLLGLGTGWIGMLPFFAAVTAAAAAGWALAAPALRPGLRDALGAALAAAAWVVLVLTAPRLLESPGGTGGALLALLMLGATLVTVAVGTRSLGRDDSNRALASL